MEELLQIGKRLKTLRAENEFSQSFVAEKLYISQSAYSQLETSHHGIIAEHLLRLSNLYEVTADYLLTGNKKLIEMNSKNGFVPFINAKAHAGFIKSFYEKDFMEDFEYYRIPGYNPTSDSVLIEIEGNSMEPTVISGDILICQTQNNLEHLLDGSIVILVTKDAILNKRVFKHTNDRYLWIESDNPNSDKKEQIRKSEILKLLMVRGKVSNVLVPHRELAFKGKLHSIEEDLKMLNKEVFKLNQKMNPEKI